MKESAAMLEIRRIKDENSLRYLKMSREEIEKEFDESTKRFIRRIGRDVTVISPPKN